ncbi:unnamed protein product [Parnassius mnemosyne]|uniref:Uncharacterized protein n=1 Tax=Parnassius mnemosyne TaxID=213953 RepID=A0AAV1L0C8_9NEOP
MACIKNWEELAQFLNSDGSGDTKSTEKWKKVLNLGTTQGNQHNLMLPRKSTRACFVGANYTLPCKTNSYSRITSKTSEASTHKAGSTRDSGSLHSPYETQQC